MSIPFRGALAAAVLLASALGVHAVHAQSTQPSATPVTEPAPSVPRAVESPPSAAPAVEPAPPPQAAPEPAPTPTVEATFLARDKAGHLVVRDDAAGFGRELQWAFSSDAALTVQEQTTTHAVESRITSINLAPAADYFILKNLSIGGVVGVTFQKAHDTKGARITVGPRFGYNFEVSRLLSFWPKVGFSYAHTTNVQQPLTAVAGGTSTFSSSTSANAVALSFFIPLMVHPARHFFAGFGPFMDSDLSGYHRATVLGAKLTLGGWVDDHELKDDEE
ncbi:MAG: hypothetical protein JWN48_2499 [Myxococcaceae bacterium]|nr:hypothetical protein [Myxococcaceae bacterium]